MTAVQRVQDLEAFEEALAGGHGLQPT